MAMGLCLALASCTTQKLDPVVAQASKKYYPQTVEVTTSDAFIAGMASLRGGTPNELAVAFANDVQAGLSKDVPGIMQGAVPARVVVQLTSMKVGPSTFTSPISEVVGTLSVVDAKSGTPVVQVPIRADDRQMKDSLNRDPLAGLAAALILKAVMPTKNLMLSNLANVVRREVRISLAGRNILGLD